MRRAWYGTLLIVSAAAGCRPAPAPVQVQPGYEGGWLDVSAGGKRYYGMYLTARSDGRVAAATGVLLMPWDDRPEMEQCSIRMEGGDTVVELRGREQRFPGRPLLLLASSNAELTVVAKDIDLSRYSSQQQMTDVVRELVSGASIPER